MSNLIEPGTPINQFLSFKISVLYRLMVRRSARFLNSSGDLSVAEWWTIGQLAMESPGTVSGIVELTQNDKAQVSRAVTVLIERGLVRKEDNPDDKRSSLLYLTDEGSALYDEIFPLRQKTQNMLLEQLNEEERAITARAIEKLTNYLLANPDVIVEAE